MIVYENSTKSLQKKMLQQKSEFSKVIEYKFSIRKSIVLVCNEQFVIEWKNLEKCLMIGPPLI